MREWRPASTVSTVHAPGTEPHGGYVMESEEAWLRAMVDAHASGLGGRAMKALLVDPFSKTVEEIDTSAAHVHVHVGELELKVTISEQALASAMRTPVMHVKTSCIADCAEDGAYITATAKCCKDGIVPRDCGFRLFGAPFFGVVALACGLQLYSPVTHKLLDVSVPLSVGDVPTPEWLRASDVRRLRKERLEAIAALRDELVSSGQFDLVVQRGIPSTLYDRTRGTCCECRREGVPVAACERCRSVYYCGRECQRAAWNRVHRGECAAMRARPATPTPPP